MKKVNVLTDTQAAYLAGLIDGEGHIRVTSGKLVVGITQAEKGIAVLHLTKKLIGTGCIGLHRAKTEKWQAVYRYRLQSTLGGIHLFEQLRPYLILKAEAFEAAIEKIKKDKCPELRPISSA